MAYEKGARPMRKARRKVCAFCVDKVDTIDYKDAAKPLHLRPCKNPSPPCNRHLRIPPERAYNSY